jgi:GNAT superfamily N-acetyltransferase
MQYAAYIKEKYGKETLELPFGFAIFSVDQGIFYIEDIYIVPEERRKGRASEMADYLTQVAKDRGCKTLLGSVNTAATDCQISLTGLIAYGFKLAKADKGLVYMTKGIN